MSPDDLSFLIRAACSRSAPKLRRLRARLAEMIDDINREVERRRRLEGALAEALRLLELHEINPVTVRAMREELR